MTRRSSHLSFIITDLGEENRVIFNKKSKQEKVDKIFTGDKKAQKMS
ncbi:hypothetical protein NEOC95_001804 [Neochlamydia sp. AcF95]|nr:hypothetical protein [Neochlamydia sp. AcF95]